MSKRTTTHQSSSSNGSQTSSVGIYITYQRKDDAAKAIAGINGATFDGRSLRYDEKKVDLDLLLIV